MHGSTSWHKASDNSFVEVMSCTQTNDAQRERFEWDSEDGPFAMFLCGTQSPVSPSLRDMQNMLFRSEYLLLTVVSTVDRARMLSKQLYNGRSISRSGGRVSGTFNCGKLVVWQNPFRRSSDLF